ncbi:cytochrome c biogenesis protein ResB [Kocuria rhizophila]|nr:cytochrome c biogenesis protein ResB [Kocuria rhizophila]
MEVPALGFVGMLRWAWRRLHEMSTALVLLLLPPAIAAVPGALFPQRVPGRGVHQLRQGQPAIGPVLDTLQLFDVYQSYWFSAIYILLFISLVGCVIRVPSSTSRRGAPSPPHSQAAQPACLSCARSCWGAGAGGAAPPGRGGRAGGGGAEARLPCEFSLGSRRRQVAASGAVLEEVGNILHVALLAVLISVAIGSLFGTRGRRWLWRASPS